MKTYEKYKSSGIEWIGDIPEHWEQTKVKFIADYINGCAFKPDEWTEETDEGKPIIRIQNLNNPTATFNYFLGEKAEKYSVKCGDILISWSASLGVFVWQGNEAWLNQHIFKVDNIKTEKPYFVWLAKKFIEEISHRTHGSTMEHLTKDAFGSFELFLPMPDEQTAIADYLDEQTEQIDKLIANKERLIELLKEERTAIINQAVTKGINADAKLKPSGIDWLGDIPEHWEVKKLKYIATIFRGKFSHRPRNDESLYGGDYPFIQTGEIARAKKFVTEFTQTLNEDGYKVTTEFPKGTLLMTIAANIGEVAILGFNACFPDSVVGFYPNDDIDNEFLFYKLKSLKEMFISTSIVNTQLNLNIDRISPISISYPSKDEQKEIVEFIESKTNEIDSTISKIEKEIELIKEYRTALISEVVTGKIKVIEK